MSAQALARPLRFGAVGLVNTAVGLLVILGSRAFLGLGDVAANGLGYACGLALSFMLNRSWTFGDRGPVWTIALRFAGVVGAAWAVNIACVLVLVRIGLAAPLAHAFGIAPYSIGVYLGCRWWVFAAGYERRSIETRSGG
jgi:putative flippase GtrA